MTVRTRFAPSPTGALHIGGVRTALYNYLFARHYGGEFLLRVEDTDRERSTQESVDVILEGMRWLGLAPDSPPVYQSDRLERYRAVVDQLIDDGQAYYCFCSAAELDAMREAQRSRGEKPRYDRRHRDAGRTPQTGEQFVVRFKTPLDGNVEFDDAVYGNVSVANTELDDLIIQRSDGLPTYNFAVVVDDIDMAISHVIRGDDHINNTPRQINIFNALNAKLPQFAHLPMILGPDGKRLSKRHGAMSVLEYQRAGYLAPAVLNYLVRLGWSHGDQEIFSHDDMVMLFDLGGVNKSPSTFNTEKLVWLNQQYLREMPPEVMAPQLRDLLERAGIDLAQGPPLSDLITTHVDRAKTLVDLSEQIALFYGPLPDMDERLAAKHLKPAIADPMAALGRRLASLDKWETSALDGALKSTLEDFDLKFGKLGPAVRVAVTGGTSGPGVDQTLALMGRERVLQGVNRALEYIANSAA